MGLKLRKRIKHYANGKWSWNGDTANGVDGFKLGIAKNGGAAITHAIDFTGATMNSFGPVKTESDLLQESGMSVGHGSGFDYLKQNSIDMAGLMSEISKENTANTLNTMGKGAALGATVGSLFPGLGTVIGGVAGGLVGGITGLFGGASRRRKLAARIRTALAQADRNNNYGLASAQSDYLTNQYGLDHDFTQDDQLYSAKDGKDLVQPIR